MYATVLHANTQAGFIRTSPTKPISFPQSGTPLTTIQTKPNQTKTGGYDSFGSCMHWGPYFAQDAFELTCESYTLPKGQGTFNDDFHTFGLYWDEVRG